MESPAASLVGLSAQERGILSLRKWWLPLSGHSGGTGLLPAKENLMLTVSGLSHTCGKEDQFARHRGGEITHSELCIATPIFHSPQTASTPSRSSPEMKKSAHCRCGTQRA